MLKSRSDLRRWVDAQRAAERRIRAESLEVSKPFHEALELIEFAASLSGWPIPEDPIRRREDAVVRQRWDTIRLRVMGEQIRTA